MDDNANAVARAQARLLRIRAIRATTLTVVVCLFAVACMVVWQLQPVPRDRIVPTPIGYRIDVNRASADELSLLPGIGPTIAQSIVAYREQHGPFTDARQLTHVRMIGEVTLRKIEPWIVLGQESGNRRQVPANHN